MRLQHVSLPIPDGAQDAGRAFYQIEIVTMLDESSGKPGR